MRLETAPVLDAPSLGYIALRTGAGAALTGGCLWIGVRWFRSRPSWLPRANRAILPFFILHHPVAVAVAAVVVQWSMGLWAKLVVVLVASLAGSLALTALAMRTGVGRAVFGVAPDAASPVPATAAPSMTPDPFAIRAGDAVSVREADRHRSMVGALQATVRRRPVSEALRWRDQGRWIGLTYAGLWERIRGHVARPPAARRTRRRSRGDRQPLAARMGRGRLCRAGPWGGGLPDRPGRVGCADRAGSARPPSKADVRRG